MKIATLSQHGPEAVGLRRSHPITMMIRLLSMMLVFGATVYADPIVLDMSGHLVETVVDEKGKKIEMLKDMTEEVTPGDVIEYLVTARNDSDSILTQVDIIGPIPKGTSYLDGTATGLPVFSIDGGGEYNRAPVTYKRVENGVEVEKTATPDMYTHAKWIVDVLPARKTSQFSYRVIVK